MYNVLDNRFLCQRSWIGILVLWLLVGYWWDKDLNRWNWSHLRLSQTPTNHSSQFVWHYHNAVPKGNLSYKEGGEWSALSALTVSKPFYCIARGSKNVFFMFFYAFVILIPSHFMTKAQQYGGIGDSKYFFWEFSKKKCLFWACFKLNYFCCK